MSYDSSGRIIWQRDALGNQTDIDYQADKTIQTLPSASFGSSFRPTIEHDYDGQRRVVKVITTPASGESITEESTYDGRWNRVAVKDGRGNTTSICYDDYGQVIRAVAPAPATGVARPITVYEYGSPSGGHQRELVKTTAPLGVTLTNSGDDPALYRPGHQ